ncbi:MAG: tRNA(Ile)-lysidine synthetase [Bacteroidetes bacterium]|nr:tRNA(Ile)-lysidine synthetase [Bacteroidota bacterium]
MLQSFLDHIRKQQLFDPSARILLTVSGGIDSVVMCELFHKAGIDFGIAHCNFQLRGDESNDDETFVEQLAEKYSVSFHVAAFDTSTFAKKNKLSVQLAARQLRYEWFESIRKQYNYTCIATAHHRDDSVETFLINLIRGTGIAGLHGILPKQGNIIRPLLFTNKEEISAFAKKHKLKHREDSSNASDKYLRNKIRHSIIPLLQELNPAIGKNIAEDIGRLRNVELIYKKEIEKKRKKIIVVEGKTETILIRELLKLNPLETYLYEFLKPYHFNGDAVENIIRALDGRSGKQFLSDTHRLVKDRDVLLIEALQMNPEKISIKKSTKIADVNGQQLVFKIQTRNAKFKIPVSKNTAAIDLEKLKFPLEIRKWEKGDAFQPIGMKGKKLLSDFFIDQKLSLIEKENVRLLISDNKIVWLIGYRMDERFKITEKTSKVFFAELT